MKLIIDIDEDYVKIINKNGASNYPEEVIKYGTPLDDVLDEMRKEIEATIDEEKAGQGNVNKGVVIGLQMALDTIDRHKAESEDKE